MCVRKDVCYTFCGICKKNLFSIEVFYFKKQEWSWLILSEKESLQAGFHKRALCYKKDIFIFGGEAMTETPALAYQVDSVDGLKVIDFSENFEPNEQGEQSFTIEGDCLYVSAINEKN